MTGNRYHISSTRYADIPAKQSQPSTLEAVLWILIGANLTLALVLAYLEARF